MRTTHVIAIAAALPGVLMLAASDASAGIIVTEGKVAHHDTRLFVNSKTACRTIAGGDSQGHDMAPVSSSDDEGTAGTQQNAERHEDGAKGGGGEPSGDLSDLDGPPPDGWTCESVGGGIEVCERTDPGAGAAPGAGAGGGLGEDDATAMASGEELAGCQATRDASPYTWLVALVALVVLRRRRYVLE
ncbi:MAG: MYXO-CTERM sorting domain-containing protein [Myxococcota bacterium]